jgi:hypothetical protein
MAGATRECNADTLSVTAQLQETALEGSLLTVPDWLSKKTWHLMCHQWLLMISCLQNNQIMRIIPIEAYAYCRHLSFPCCFHCHYSFLYSFSWQPFSLLLSLESHFEMQVDCGTIPPPSYFHLDIDKSSTASYHTVQTAVTTKWEYQNDLLNHMNQQLPCDP